MTNYCSVALHPDLAMTLRISGAADTHFARNFAGSPALPSIALCASKRVRFTLSALPFSSGVQGAEKSDLNPSFPSSFAALTYSPPPLLYMRLAGLPVCRSSHLIYLISSAAASPFDFENVTDTWPEASSTNVTKYSAPPGEVVCIGPHASL